MPNKNGKMKLINHDPDLNKFLGIESTEKQEKMKSFTLSFNSVEWEEIEKAYELSPAKSKGAYLKNAIMEKNNFILNQI